MDACENTEKQSPLTMTTLNTTCPSTEVLEDALLTLDQISTRITVLTLIASRNPVQSVRFRKLIASFWRIVRTVWRVGDLLPYNCL